MPSLKFSIVVHFGANLGGKEAEVKRTGGWITKNAIRNGIIEASTTDLPISPHQTRPSSGLIAPIRRLDGCKCWRTPPLTFRPQAVQPPPPAQGPPCEGRDWRGRITVEETMRLLTIDELLRLTQVELYDLWRWIANELPKFSGGSRDRLNALTNLLNIRFALSRRNFSP